MRTAWARQAGGARFPFLRTDGRRYVALALAAGFALAALGFLSVILSR